MALRRLKEKAGFLCCVAKGDEKVVAAIFCTHHIQIREFTHSFAHHLEDVKKLDGAWVSGLAQRSKRMGQLSGDFKAVGRVDLSIKGRRSVMRE